MTLVSWMPWWVGCVLALVFYVLLHRVANPVVTVAATSLNQLGEATTQMIWKTLASIGQYVLPIACLIGAAISALNRQRRKKLLGNVVSSNTPDALNGMSWQEFELLVGEAFRLEGYQVAELGGGGADGGVDLLLRKNGDKFLVQCKQWKAFTVGVTIVRELYGVMAASAAAGGFVVTSGKFTSEAQAFSNGRNIKLIDGTQLFELIHGAKAVRGSSIDVNTLTEKPAPTKVVTNPTCPICTKPMVQRTAKKGSSVGKPFWGCSGYPACRGTRQME